MAVHTCCVPVRRGAVRDGVPESACAAVASAPLESWHVRHLKHDAPCRAAPPRAMLEPAHQVVDAPLHAAALPRAWADEYRSACVHAASRTHSSLARRS